MCMVASVMPKDEETCKRTPQRSDLEELFEAIEYCARFSVDDGGQFCEGCPVGADYKLCGVALGTVDNMRAIGRLGGYKWDDE